MKTKKYEVRLNIPTAMWAIIEVEAKNSKEAKAKALAENESGNVSYEYEGFQNSDAEVVAVEECE